MTKRMSRKTWNAQSRATFFRHSAVLSLTAVLLRKLPNDDDGGHTPINKLTSVFYASALLLIMNFVITLSK